MLGLFIVAWFGVAGVGRLLVVLVVNFSVLLFDCVIACSGLL